ncbi:hypothetical protein COOONC_19687 [Cooperia oncophora]
MYEERYYSSPVAGYPPYYESPVTYTPPPHRAYLQRYPYPPPIDPYYPPSPYYYYPSFDMRHGYRRDFEEGCLGACLGCCLAYLLCCCLTTTGDCYC